MRDAPRDTPRGGRAVVPVLLALATVAALWTAGTATEVTPPEPGALSSQRVARSLSCVTGLPGGRAVVGSLRGKVTTDRALRAGVADVSEGRTGLVVRAGSAAAGSTFASQSASAGRWYAAQGCPEPSRQQWFVGAGGGRLHHSVLTLSNARSGEAVVDVRVFGPGGEMDVPGLRGLSVGRQPRRLDLAEVAPNVGDLAVGVTAVKGLVSASVVDEWSPTPIARSSTEFLPGQADAATDVVIGGLPAEREEATLMVLNTGASAAVVTVELIGRRGTFEPTRRPTVTAPPGRVTQVAVPPAGRQGAHGLRLTSPQPIVAGVRAQVGPDVVHAAPLGVLGDSAVVGVPVRAAGTLRLFNGDEDAPASARVAFVGPRGRVLDRQRVTVGPGSALEVRSRVLRSGAVRAVTVAGGGQLRGVLELRRGGVAAIPIQSVTAETRVPAVLPHD